MLSTFGSPIRIPDRSLCGRGEIAAERFLADAVGHIGIRIPGLLHVGFDDAHFAGVLDETFRAAVVDDHALPSFGDRDLAPGAALGPLERHVDEPAPAIHWAPVAHGVRRRRRLVREAIDYIEATESRAPSLFPPVHGEERCAYGS